MMDKSIPIMKKSTKEAKMGVRELLYLVFALALVNGIIGGLAVKSFLSRTKSISTAPDLAALKTLARQQMYQALLQMALLGGGCIIGIFGLITAKIGLSLVLILNGLVFVMGMALKGTEKQARSLPVDDPALQMEYKRVCDSWNHKPFPDF